MATDAFKFTNMSIFGIIESDQRTWYFFGDEVEGGTRQDFLYDASASSRFVVGMGEVGNEANLVLKHQQHTHHYQVGEEVTKLRNVTLT